MSALRVMLSVIYITHTHTYINTLTQTYSKQTHTNTLYVFIVHIFIYSNNRKEGNVLFNNALNIFYLRLYGVRHMVKYHTDSEIGNLLPPHELLFPINSKGSFICTIPQTGLHIPQPLLHQLWSTG